MSYRKVDIQTFALQPFEAIGEKWTLITAAKDGAVNTMTASWAQLGVLWGKNVMTIYIRPQRYTKEFVDAADRFTVTLFDGHKKELGVLGTKSGRDGDKISEVNFHLDTVDGQPTFREGKTVFVCKKLYHGRLQPAEFLERSVIGTHYPASDFHDVYIGEIEGIYENDDAI